MAKPSWIRGTFPYRWAKRSYHWAYDRVRQADWHTGRVVRTYLRKHETAKLHVGCGDNMLAGWLNTEFEFRAHRSVIHLDATKPFPLPDSSFDLIFSEHMIEHLPLPAALNMLRECFRVLKPRGRVRISTPPLEFFINLMTNPGADHIKYCEFHFSEWGEDSPVRTPAVVVADYYTKWGHQFIYDEPTLRALMKAAGFTEIEKTALRESREPMLRDLENEERLPAGLLRLVTFTLEGVKR